MTEIGRQLDEYQDGFDRAQIAFDNQIKPSSGDVSALTSGNGLDVLEDGPEDKAGFRQIEVDICNYLTTPQILGRVLLLENRVDKVMNPAVIVPKPGHPGYIRIARLNTPYVPKVGLTDGLRFGVAIEAETQAPGFGSHGNNVSPFEPGHLGTVLTTGVSRSYGEELVAKGDIKSHEVIQNGLPHVFSQLGLLSKAPVPTVQEFDTRTFKPGQRFPFNWHSSLRTKEGAAIATFPGAVNLVIGAAVNGLPEGALDTAGNFVEYAVAGAR